MRSLIRFGMKWGIYFFFARWVGKVGLINKADHYLKKNKIDGAKRFPFCLFGHPISPRKERNVS